MTLLFVPESLSPYVPALVWLLFAAVLCAVGFGSCWVAGQCMTVTLSCPCGSVVVQRIKVMDEPERRDLQRQVTALCPHCEPRTLSPRGRSDSGPLPDPDDDPRSLDPAIPRSLREADQAILSGRGESHLVIAEDPLLRESCSLDPSIPSSLSDYEVCP